MTPGFKSCQIGATTRSTTDLTAIVAAHMVSCRCKYDDQVSMTVQSANNAPSSPNAHSTGTPAAPILLAIQEDDEETER